MEYKQAVDWVHGLPRLASTPGIEGTKRLLNKLGNPQDKLKFVHVAGTNGKGSVTMMTAAILKAAGYRVGAMTSPFVTSFRERFFIDGELPERQKVAQVLTAVKSAAEQDMQQIVGFDAVTAAAILLFSQQNCDIVCMETGLGGRLDSTNAVQNTLVACITAIDKDHTELLGNTLDKIAAEKCGIFKNNCDVVCYPAQETKALDVIIEHAKNNDCALILPKESDLITKADDENSLTGSVRFGNSFVYKALSVNLPLFGYHQALNATVAIEAALALRGEKHGYNIDDEHIVKGLECVSFQARIEILCENPLIILDGAHNPHGARALAKVLKGTNCKNMSAVIGVLKRGDVREMMGILCPNFSKIYTVKPQSPRAMEQAELCEIAKEFCENTTACADVEQGVLNAVEHAKANGTGLVICGSLYLASQARALLVQTQDD